jgi:KUP system potassium uptake protein
VHVNTVDEPYTSEYTVKQIVPNEVIRVEFQLGFRVSPSITLMFKKVIEEMVRNHEIAVDAKYERLQRTIPVGDTQFVVMEKFLSSDNDLPFHERVIMNFYFWIKEKSLSEEKGFGLDQSNVVVEKFPLLINPVNSVALKRRITPSLKLSS